MESQQSELPLEILQTLMGFTLTQNSSKEKRNPSKFLEVGPKKTNIKSKKWVLYMRDNYTL